MIQSERWVKVAVDALPAQLERIYTRFKRGLMPQGEFFSKMDRLLAGQSVGTLTWEHGMYPRISREWLEANLARVTDLIRLSDEYDRITLGIERLAWGEPATPPEGEAPAEAPQNLAVDYQAWLENQSELDSAYLSMQPKGYFVEGKLAHRASVSEDGTFRMAKTDEDFEAFVGAWIEALQRLVDGLKDFAVAHGVVP